MRPPSEPAPHPPGGPPPDVFNPARRKRPGFFVGRAGRGALASCTFFLRLVAWRKGVPQYRVYSLNAGRIAGPLEVLQCEDDNEAIDKAKQLLHGKALEIWTADRRVTVLDPKR